nr:hypothetical protein Itr_chr11CG19210 [Ipomoea trifida]GMD52604.1 hypothetical protein Iba_chr11bCG13210 [Ipomoea batatas]
MMNEYGIDVPSNSNPSRSRDVSPTQILLDQDIKDLPLLKNKSRTLEKHKGRNQMMGKEQTEESPHLREVKNIVYTN